MDLDKLRLFWKAIVVFVPIAGKLMLGRITALRHRWSYRAVSDAKTVLVLGGSFAGLELARRLSQSLPTGYKCVLLEKNSHFHYLFNFPRYSVVEGHEQAAFIPYDRLQKNAPEGAFTQIQDSIVDLTETHAILASGETIVYHFLVIATGSIQPLPAKLLSTERDQACSELQTVQQAINDANDIAVVGAGAVGVEIATDIADFYPHKKVTLVHSRGQILNQFGRRLHDYVLSTLKTLDVRVLLNERPLLQPGSGLSKSTSLTFSGGNTEYFDLVIHCTGQRPNSSFLHSLYPKSISSSTSRIRVAPTMQLRLSSDDTIAELSTNVFALGDVAEHKGPRMARAAFFQSQVVLENILAIIHGKTPTKSYIPRWDFEGAIKLTLGRNHYVFYCVDEGPTEPIEIIGVIGGHVNHKNDNDRAVRDILVPGHDGKLDLDVRSAWKWNGADLSLLKEVMKSEY